MRLFALAVATIAAIFAIALLIVAPFVKGLQ
jgi:hypothetical protein